jgi:hypothetical protein
VAELIAVAGFLVLLVGGIVATDALRRKGDEKDPERPVFVERDRAKSEAQMAAPVSEADEEAAAPYVAYVEEIGTNEFPTLAFDADPLGAPIPDGYVIEDEAYFNDVTAKWLAAFTWTAEAAPPVPLSSVQVVEPEPFEVMGFTQSWTTADVQRMVAKAKSGANR